MKTKVQHLHPLMILYHAIHLTKDWVIAWVSTLVLLIKKFPDLAPWILIGYFVLLSWISFQRYWTTTYEFTATSLEVRKGWLIKRHRSVPYARMQTFHSSQWFFLKPFDLLSVKVETQSTESNGAEVFFPLIAESFLTTLKQKKKAAAPDVLPMNHEAPEAAQEPPAKILPTYQTRTRDILLFGLTDLHIFATLLALVGLAFHYLPDTLLTSISNRSLTLFQSSKIFFLLLCVLVFCLILLFSLFKQWLLYTNFTVTRHENQLLIESGLFERRQQSIAIQAIQAVEIRQQLLRQWFHLTSISVHLAGDFKEDMEHKILVFPILPEKQTTLFLESLLPEWPHHLHPLEPLTRHQLFYYWRIPLLWTLPLTFVCAYFGHWLAVFPLFAGVFWLAVNTYKARQQALYFSSDTQATFQTTRLFTKVITFTKQQKMITCRSTTTPFLRKKQIEHFSFRIRSGRTAHWIDYHYLSEQDAARILTFFNRRKKER